MGRYELRDEIVLGVEVAGVYWVDQGQRSLVIRLARDRVALLAEALDSYLQGA
jgi:hypothetical protein